MLSATNASLSAGVLNISRMAWQDKVVLRYSNAASDKDLTQGNSGELLWNGSQVALTSQTFQQINTVAPLSASGANIITFEMLWKPSTVSVGVGLQTTTNNANGTLTITLDGTESGSALKLIDTQSVVRPLAASITGTLVWNGTQLVDINALSSYSTTTAMNNAISTALGSYTTTSALTTLLNG